MIQHIMREKCDTCIFHPGNLMFLENGCLESIVRGCDEEDTNVVCHQSDIVTGNMEVNAWCKGSVDRRAGKTVRFLRACNALVEVIE